MVCALLQCLIGCRHLIQLPCPACFILDFYSILSQCDICHFLCVNIVTLRYKQQKFNFRLEFPMTILTKQLDKLIDFWPCRYCRMPQGHLPILKFLHSKVKNKNLIKVFFYWVVDRLERIFRGILSF